MKLLCPSCGNGVPDADVNLDQGFARCLRCDAVFGLFDRDDDMLAPAKNVEQPASIHLDHWGPELVLTWRWYDRDVWGLAFFCVFWDGFLVLWYALCLSSLFFGAPESEKPGIMPLVFPLIHVAVGVGLTYSVLAEFLNRTTIRITITDLEVRHGPLPAFGNRWLACEEIERVYATGGKRANVQLSSNQRKDYGVWAEAKDGERVPLVRGLKQPEEAWFLQNAIGRFLICDF